MCPIDSSSRDHFLIGDLKVGFYHTPGFPLQKPKLPLSFGLVMSKTGAIVAVMEEYVRRRRMEDLLALRGKVQIDYDWQREEELEMAADAERERHGDR